jgi:hypothetical protein
MHTCTYTYTHMSELLQGAKLEEMAQLARDLGAHPNLVAFVGELSCSMTGQIGFACELMMGGTLASRLR